jgi:hypothetical protein
MRIYKLLTLIAAIVIAVIEAMMFTSGTTAAPLSGPPITVVTPGTAVATPLPTDEKGTDAPSGSGVGP